jgi:hypothetical protein
MALLEFQTKCPCGAFIKAKVKKPTPMEPSISKLRCGQCGSRFLMSLVRDMERKDERIFKTHIEEVEITDTARDVVASNLAVKAKIMAAKAMSTIGREPNLEPRVGTASLD